MGNIKINFDAKKLDIVDINNVQPNPWNPKDKENDEYKRVRESIAQNGLKQFVLVRELGKDKYEIIDGEQRWTACRELEFDEILIYNEGKMDDIRAKELTLWFQQQVPFNQVQLSFLVTEMLAERPDLILPFSRQEIDKFKATSEFNMDDYKTESTAKSLQEIKRLNFELSESQYEFCVGILKDVQEDQNLSMNEAFIYIVESFNNKK